jgi:hypothetical protein
MPAPRIVGLVFLVAAGCVGGESVPPREPVIQPAAPSAARPTDQSAAKKDSPDAKTSVKIPASPSGAEQPRKTESAAPGKPAASPPLNLASLEQRLRDTKAIGVFTKISLKNQVDDLLTQFRAFHEGGAGGLTELREKYNLLLLKVLSLLQTSDPVLAQAVAASREAIWGLLADPAKFATL